MTLIAQANTITPNMSASLIIRPWVSEDLKEDSSVILRTNNNFLYNYTGSFPFTTEDFEAEKEAGLWVAVVKGSANDFTTEIKNEIASFEYRMAALGSGFIYPIPQSGNTPANEPAPTVNGVYRAEAGTYANWLDLDENAIVVPTTDGFIYEILVSGIGGNGLVCKLDSTDLNVTTTATVTEGSMDVLTSGGGYDIKAALEIDLQTAIDKQSNQVFDRPDLKAETIAISKDGFIISIQEKAINIIREFVYDFDRPDLTEVKLSVDNLIISEIKSYIKLLDYIFDRPDLSTVYVDYQGRIVSEEKKYEIFSSNLPKFGFYNPPLQETFNIEQADVTDYDTLISKWDAIKTNASATDNYVTKEQIGTSSTLNESIYVYKFIPENPTYKVLIINGTHASEKAYMHLSHKFMSLITTEWYNDDFLKWMRLNVEIHVIPALSAAMLDGEISDPTSVIRGSRRTFETTPFPITWSSVNGTVNIAFDINDFPDTAGRLDAATYFSNSGILNKCYLSIYNSSDDTIVSDYAHLITGLVSGTEVQITVSDTSTSSGTATMYISTDINRNFPYAEVWDNFTPQSNLITRGTTDYSYSSHDNKGTKPFSTAEAIALKSLLDSNSYDTSFDLHVGAGTNFCTSLKLDEPLLYKKITDNIKEFTSIFNNFGYTAVRSDVLSTPIIGVYNAAILNGQNNLIEWDLKENYTQLEMTDALRWLFTCVAQFTINKIK